jgi:hypothetical protein
MPRAGLKADSGYSTAALHLPLFRRGKVDQ